MKRIYDYHCGACNHQFEKFAGTDDKQVDCPACHGKMTANRMLSGFGSYKLKGGGFYETDFRNKK